jgi:hypothetical protein
VARQSPHRFDVYSDPDHGQTFYFDDDQISDSETGTDPAPKEVSN